MEERSLLVSAWVIQRGLKAFGSQIPLDPMGQAGLYPWCSLKIAVSISSKSCFLKFSYVCSSQLVANQKAFPSRLPNNGHSLSDGLGTQAQERQNCPQPIPSPDLPISSKLKTARWAEVTPSPRQKTKLDARLPSNAVGPHANPRAESGQGFKTKVLKHCTKGENWFHKDRTIELHH